MNTKQLITLHNKGKSADEIATALELSISTVRKLLFENGLSRVRNYSYVLTKEEIIACYEAGLSSYEIAKKYNVSLPTVYSYLKKFTDWKPVNLKISESIRAKIKKKHFEDYQSMLSLAEEYKLAYHSVRKICYPELYKTKKRV